MDFRQLRYFAAIVETGSLSRASQRLHIAQSALSHHLKALENELGKVLMVRGGKGVQLTGAGIVLYRHSQSILKQVELARTEVSSSQEGVVGRVTGSLPATVGDLLLVPLLRTLAERYPGIRLNLLQVTSVLARELLENGRLDLAVLYLSGKQRGLNSRFLYDEEFHFVSPEAIGRTEIPLAEVVQHKMILPSAGQGVRLVFDTVCEQENLTYSLVAEIDGIKQIRDAVAAGFGASIFPTHPRAHPALSLGLHTARIVSPVLTRPISVCSLQAANTSPAVDVVINLIAEIAATASGKSISPSDL